MSDPFATLRKRIVLLLGFAYLMLYALASGLALSLPLTADADPNAEPWPSNPKEDKDNDDATVKHPTLHGTPSQTDYRPRPHPRPDPHAPGLHVRPDGSRYLIVPLNFAGAAA
ncbi:hypothetical protein AB0B28_09155 [Glycomyces sp. NPDC046736]|uniref:hypothetical protein n=1 Tax=Glycomyces sp. NPDC046736 TaxID=3155615 RepID=UPI0033D2AD46